MKTIIPSRSVDNPELLQLDVFPANTIRNVKFWIFADSTYICYDEGGFYERCLAVASEEEKSSHIVFLCQSLVGKPEKEPYVFQGRIEDKDVLIRCALLQSQLINDPLIFSPLCAMVASYLAYIFWREINSNLQVPLQYSGFLNVEWGGKS